jgi:hypothetical protein
VKQNGGSPSFRLPELLFLLRCWVTNQTLPLCKLFLRSQGFKMASVRTACKTALTQEHHLIREILVSVHTSVCSSVNIMGVSCHFCDTVWSSCRWLPSHLGTSQLPVINSTNMAVTRICDIRRTAGSAERSVWNFLWRATLIKVCIPEVRRLGHEADHSPPSSAEVKNAWSYISTPPYVSMVWCLIKYRIVFMAWNVVKHRDNFTFTYIFRKMG